VNARMGDAGSAGDRLAVVTGSGGIGVACARSLADRQVILVDLDREKLEAAAEALRTEGVSVETHVCDVSDRASTDALADALAEREPVGVLVHTAGVSGTLCDSATVIRVNLGGFLNVLYSSETLVTAGTVGIFISSIGGHQEFTHHLDPLLAAPEPLDRLEEAGALDVRSPSVAYAIAKRGVIVQCRKRAAAWGARGGRLLSISPGLIADTPMGAASYEHGPGRPYAEWSALGRNGRASEIAAVVRFLASPDASFMTGCDVVIDGGLLAGIDHHVPLETRKSWHACAYTYLGHKPAS